MNIPHSYSSSGLSMLHGNGRKGEQEWQNERMRDWEPENSRWRAEEGNVLGIIE